MLNIIKADMYRIIRGKGLYITLAIILVVNILVMGSLHAFHSGALDATMGIGITIGSDLEGQEAFDAAMAEIQAISFDGIHAAEILTQGMENFLWFLLPVVVIVASAIFTHGTVKNDIAFGISRPKLYMSKLALSIGISVIFLLFYMMTGMLVATVLGGFGTAAAGYWANLVQVLGAQLLMIIAMVCIGIFFVFTTKRTAAVNGAFIAFILAPAIIISILTFADPWFERLFDFDMTTNIMRLANLRYLETREIATALGLGSFYILATTIGGIALFKRAEIK